MASILIVEDQPDVAVALGEHLEAQGHTVRVAETAAAGRRALHDRPPDLVVLDLMLPDGTGERLLTHFRRRGYQGPILILSAKGEVKDRVRGLEGGADDYVTKPFHLLEFLARVEALLRRAPETRELEVVRIGDVELRPAARTLTIDGKEVPCRPREMDLLLALLRRPNEAVSREDLLAQVWGYSRSARTRTIDWHVSELRRRLESDPKKPRILRTVPGVGYRLDVP